MVRTIYDFSGVDGLPELLNAEIKDERYSIVPGHELADKDTKDTAGSIAILTDNFFSTKDFTDGKRLAFVERIRAIEVIVVFIGVERDNAKFASELQRLGAIYNFSNSGDVDGETVIKMVNRAIDKAEQLRTELGEGNEADETASQSEPAKLTINKTVSENGTNNTCVLISGAPGIGTTFVGVNLANFLAQENETSYYECGLRPVLTTWVGLDENLEASANFNSPAVNREKLAIYTRNPFGESDVPLRNIAERIQNTNSNHVLDLALQDYIAATGRKMASHDVRVLVTNADYHRLRYLEGLPADIVVVNGVPNRMPFDESEFQAFWPSAKIVFVPYIEEQSAYIAEARFVTDKSEVLTDALLSITSVIEKGGELIENSIAG